MYFIVYSKVYVNASQFEKYAFLKESVVRVIKNDSEYEVDELFVNSSRVRLYIHLCGNTL